MNRRFMIINDGAKAYAEPLQNANRAIFMGTEGRYTSVEQVTANPDDTNDIFTDPQEVVALNDVLTTPGGCSSIYPQTYNNTDGWNAKRVGIEVQEAYAYEQTCTYVDSTHSQGPINVINGTGAYSIIVKLNTLIKIEGTDYTMDYSAGTITWINSITISGSDTVTLTGYYLINDVTVDDGTYYSRFIPDGEELIVYDLLNGHFENWTSSTNAEKWTEQGTVARNTASIQGTYCAKLTAASGSWNYVEQTVTLPSATTQTAFVAVVKPSAQAMIKVSMDSGSTWNTCSIDVTSITQAADKWVMLYVNSLVNSTSTVMVRIYSQINNTDTGTLYIAACALLEGGI